MYITKRKIILRYCISFGLYCTLSQCETSRFVICILKYLVLYKADTEIVAGWNNNTPSLSLFICKCRRKCYTAVPKYVRLYCFLILLFLRREK
jgi:hypothetical protein